MIQNQNTASKKGQATLIIIAALVIFLVLALYYAATESQIVSDFLGSISSTTAESLEQSEQREEINECFSEYAKQGLKLLQAQGGFIILPREHVFFDEAPLGLFFKEGIIQVSASSMEEELSEYMRENVQRACFENEEEYTIEQGDLKVEARFTQESLKIEAEWLLGFRSNKDPTQFFSFDSFAVVIDTHMLQLFEEAELLALEGMDYTTQYYSENAVNRTQILHDEAHITLLSTEEEYFIAATEKEIK